MHPIQKPQAPKINQKLLMMQIMHLRASPQKIIAAMHSSRLRQLESQERPVGQDMAF